MAAALAGAAWRGLPASWEGAAGAEVGGVGGEGAGSGKAAWGRGAEGVAAGAMAAGAGWGACARRVQREHVVEAMAEAGGWGAEGMAERHCQAACAVQAQTAETEAGVTVGVGTAQGGKEGAAFLGRRAARGVAVAG